ncbi:hypothetical protein HYFRA_00006296 [Hymenoscyphus fraxineus]|uniref:Uncharacterized protein n=1 Tax=Hymenoscyphus fraxineus TaxID=746836 RepID=A0A9N9LC31_9HELO|nr:hypothetical protein HYFRA_00006296 [Hymenoscyphus fraxineus]
MALKVSHVIDMFGKFLKDKTIPLEKKTIEKFQQLVGACQFIASTELQELVEQPPPLLLFYRAEVVLWGTFWPDESFPWSDDGLDKELQDLKDSHSKAPASEVELQSPSEKTTDKACPLIVTTDHDSSGAITENPDSSDTVAALSYSTIDAKTQTLGIQPAAAQLTPSPATRQNHAVPRDVEEKEAEILRDQITRSICAKGADERLPEWAPNGAPLRSVRFPVDNFSLLYFGFKYNKSSLSAKFSPKLNLEHNYWKGVFVLRAADVMQGVHRVHYMWIEFSEGFQHLAEVKEWASEVKKMELFLIYLLNNLIKRQSDGGFTLALPKVDTAWKGFVQARYNIGKPALKIEQITEVKDLLMVVNTESKEKTLDGEH